jgi:neutral amino acid transport system ATP-binding protein
MPEATADRDAGAEPILVVDSVVKHYGGVHAVNEASLTVDQGTITGLIGPNGAGKSTLLELISGFQRVDAGRIMFEGRPVQNLPAYAVSRRGIVRTFQAAREWPALTVMENVLLAATPREAESVWRALLLRRQLARIEAEARSRAREMLHEFGLYKLRDEPSGNLSGGQKRLLEFARIACAQPRLVLLDEPQTGVNPVLGERMAEAIRTLNATGVSVVLVEHNLSFVEKLCDPVWVMDLGKAIAVGSMSTLRRNSAVVDAYLGSVAANA